MEKWKRDEGGTQTGVEGEVEVVIRQMEGDGGRQVKVDFGQVWTRWVLVDRWMSGRNVE